MRALACDGTTDAAGARGTPIAAAIAMIVIVTSVGVGVATHACAHAAGIPVRG